MKKTKLLALLLALVTVLGLLASCGSTETPVITTEQLTEAITEAPAKDITIAEAGNVEYVVVRVDNLGTDSPSVREAINLRNLLKEKYGTDVAISTDWYNDRIAPLPESAKEIVIGQTNRVETANALAKIREKDFIITFENDRLIITGGCEEATARACAYFTENYVNKADGSLVIKDDIEYIDRYDYVYASVAINGVDIRKYSIVYPADAAMPVKFAAMNLADYILNYAGLTIPLVTDKEAETEYEILVGETNRAASAEAVKVKLADDEFLLAKSGNKLVMLGKEYMCAAACGKLMNVCLAATGLNTAANAVDIPEIAAAKPDKPVWKETQNVILMIGDGMGRNQVLQTIADGKISRWEGDTFPGQAYCTTYSYSVQIGKSSYTDSAASATALATGYKTYNGYVGLSPQKKTIKNVRELANEIGAKTSILTTDKITGATPAAFLAHEPDRDSTENIQTQINKVVADDKVQYCKGSVENALFADVRESLQLISDNGSRFFTMIEEAFPDKGGHNNDLAKMMTGVKRLNECVSYAACFTMMHPDTALIVTADHETGGLTPSGNTYTYTVTTHTNTDVPVYAIGAGVQNLIGSGKIDNLDISRFIAKTYGASSWGQK